MQTLAIGGPNMQITKTKFFKFLFCPTLFLFAIFLLLFSYRLTGFVLLVALAVSYFHFLRTSRTALMRIVFVSFLIAVFLPIDVTLKNVPGPPRFVPLIMGLPSEPTVERARRGDVMLGGCMVRGTEPRWLWVW